MPAVKEIKVKSYLTKSNLPGSDFVINPYAGCPHACKYCYASFMKKFTGHEEDWGEFTDVKLCDEKIDLKKISGKNIFMSSVTDCYNPLEKKYRITESVLRQLRQSDCNLTICTKSNLILRDAEILKGIRNLTVAVSVNTLDENFKNDMDCASGISQRLSTLETLHSYGIRTVLFMSPIFPYITEWKEIMMTAKGYTDEFWLENLNLRGDFKDSILNYIKRKYPELYGKYTAIYLNGDNSYWTELSEKAEKFCLENGIAFKNLFHQSSFSHENTGKQKHTSKSENIQLNFFDLQNPE